MPLRRCSLRPAISIHALREEGDQRAARADRSASDFYPRPPRGGRHIPPCAPSVPHQFLSTPSARRATCGTQRHRSASIISIHALREEGDSVGLRFAPLIRGFLSTPSARRATPRCRTSLSSIPFLSTPSARRATAHHSCRSTHRCISIHALREEGDRNRRYSEMTVIEFLSTPSARRAT